MAGGNKIKPVFVPLSDRTYITGYAEMCGYLGGISKDKLIADYINEGLIPTLWHNTYRWNKHKVDQWIEDHNEYQQVNVRPGRRRKKAEA
jgi:hypothetical protein